MTERKKRYRNQNIFNIDMQDKQDTDTETDKTSEIVSRKVRKAAKFRKKNKEKHTPEKENCIDVQDGEDGGPDTEKPPKIRNTIILYPGQKFNPLSLEKKKITHPFG